MFLHSHRRNQCLSVSLLQHDRTYQEDKVHIESWHQYWECHCKSLQDSRWPNYLLMEFRQGNTNQLDRRQEPSFLQYRKVIQLGMKYKMLDLDSVSKFQ